MSRLEGLPADLQRFIEDRVPSVPFLEALLLVRAQPEQPWDARRLADRLYMSEQHAAQLLQQLHDRGLLVETATGAHYNYDPADAQLRAQVTQLSDIYSRRLVEISNLIHAAYRRRQSGS